MTATDETWPPPEWMRLIEPGRLDPRVLDQSVWWVTREAVVQPLAVMSESHLLAVAQMLRGRPMQMHLWAIVDALVEVSESVRTGVPCGHLVEYAVTGGSSLADVDPQVWLADIDRGWSLTDTSEGARRGPSGFLN
jgi:hypothetical protein